MERDGFGIEGTFTNRDEAAEWCDNRQEIVPLYRHARPTLTDAERALLAMLADHPRTHQIMPHEVATIRGLLERLGGGE